MSRNRPHGQGTWKAPRPRIEIVKAAGVGLVVVLVNAGLVWAFAPETHSAKPPPVAPPASTAPASTAPAPASTAPATAPTAPASPSTAPGPSSSTP